MIACNLHARKYVVAHCALQERASTALIEAQRGGDAVCLVLFDRDDPRHRCIATIGLDETTNEELRLVLIDTPNIGLVVDP